MPNLALLQAFGLCRSLTFNYVSWSISAEMGMYLIFPLLIPVATRRRLSLLVCVTIFVTLTIISNRMESSWLIWSFDFGALRALPTFLLGMTAFQYRSPLGRLPWAAGWLLVVSAVFLGGCLLQWPRLALLPLIYIIGVLGIAASERPALRIACRIAPLGQLTYSLYMLHPLVQSVVLTGVGATFLKLRGYSMNLFVIGVMMLMLPIALLSLVFFERPARRWLTRLLGMSRTAPKEAMFTPDSRW